MKLHKGDNVKIIKGKDKGKLGKIERVYPSIDKVLVEGVNQFKRHLKNRGFGRPSEIATISKPLPVSNVAMICPKCSKMARIGFMIRNNEKVRICKKCEETI